MKSILATHSRRLSRGIALGSVAAAVSVLLATPAVAQLDEMHAYGVNNFGGKNECTGADDHSVHTKSAAAFAAPFQLFQILGLWDQTGVFKNKNVRGGHFSDLSKVAGGKDSATDAGADEADVIYLHTHGSSSTTDTPPWSLLMMGNSAEACRPHTDTHMLWNDDLDIAVLKACQSAMYEVWAGGGYRAQFSNSSSPIRMWNGFHGDSSCGDHVVDYVANYAWESFYDGVGENWMEEAYQEDGNSDDCPVSVVMGDSLTKASSLFHYGGWLDRKDTGAKTMSVYYYFAGCDPEHGSVL